MRMQILAKLLALFTVAAVCCGCGGGASTGSMQSTMRSGVLQFNIVWPMVSRVIPAAAQSLVIQVSFGSQSIVRKIVPRPPIGTNTTSIRFDALPPGVVQVTVTAYPTPDGTGVAQAIGGTTVAIISGIVTQASIDPSSTVDRIDLSPDPIVTIVGRTTSIVPSPKDAQNALVLVAPSSLQWTSTSPGVATVDAAGHVFAAALGQSLIRVVDSESGKTAAVNVHVVQPLVIDPPSATISINDRQQFTATVAALSSSNVTWKVLETSNSGSIDETGLYTAPNQAGTFHVVATSVSNPEISATAIVIVQSGSGTIIIN